VISKGDDQTLLKGEFAAKIEQLVLGNLSLFLL